MFKSTLLPPLSGTLMGHGLCYPATRQMPAEVNHKRLRLRIERRRPEHPVRGPSSVNLSGIEGPRGPIGPRGGTLETSPSAGAVHHFRQPWTCLPPSKL